MSRLSIGAALSLLGILLFGAMSSSAIAQANPAASQCEKCIQSGITIYRTSRDEQAAYCRKIGMCPAAHPKLPAPLPNIPGGYVRPPAAQAPDVVVPRPAAQPPVVSANGAASISRSPAGAIPTSRANRARFPARARIWPFPAVR